MNLKTLLVCCVIGLLMWAVLIYGLHGLYEAVTGFIDSWGKK